jgi:ribonuclease P/MRP protein subunit POP5
MKHLPKHLRPRWRYLAVALESWPDAEFTRRDLQRELWFAGRRLLGDPGSADADLTVLDVSMDDGVGTAVVRTRRDAVADARAAVACVHEVAGAPVRTTVTGVSGTVRACEEKYLGRPAEVKDTNVVFDDADRRATARNGLLDVRTDGSYTGATRLDIE